MNAKKVIYFFGVCGDTHDLAIGTFVTLVFIVVVATKIYVPHLSAVFGRGVFEKPIVNVVVGVAVPVREGKFTPEITLR